MSEINPKLNASDTSRNLEAVGPLSLADVARTGPSVPSPLQFARAIQSLSPRLVERFRTWGIDVAGAETTAQEFTRKLATVFYALDIQPGSPDPAWSLTRRCQHETPLPYAMALHAILPDLVQLCAGGASQVPPTQRNAGASLVIGGQSRRRLLLLAALVGCMTPADSSVMPPAPAADNLALSLVRWAKSEMAASAETVTAAPARRMDS